jgi:2-phosphosulfolactate phosphatase
MEFRLHTIHNASEAKGLVVVIDVLRACTTMCYVFKNGAKTIFPVTEVEDAFRMKKEKPEALLLGERHGLPIEGFDYPNAPSQIQKTDFTNKSIIITTSAGVKGITQSTKADEIITGSFVNANAISTYIKRKKIPLVSFIPTDFCTFDHEDYLCASYIRGLLEEKPRDFTIMKQYLIDSPHSDGFLRHPLTSYAREDFELCMQINVFPFIIKSEKKNNTLQLTKSDIE